MGIQRKHNRLWTGSKKAVLAAAVMAGLSTVPAQAAFYFDMNGATPGSGATNATWGGATPTAAWSTDSTGSSVTTTVWDTTQQAVFAAGTDAVGPYAITVTGDPDVSGVLIEEGAWTFTGRLDLVNNTGITVNAGSGNVTFTDVRNVTSNNLASAYTFTNNSTSLLTVSLARTGGNFGATFTGSGNISAALNNLGSGNILKSGNGILTLTGGGNNTSNGTRSIDAGILQVAAGANPLGRSSSVTVNAAGTLGGKGSVSSGGTSGKGLVDVFGTLAPGLNGGTVANQIGTLTINRYDSGSAYPDLRLRNGGAYEWHLRDADGVAGTGYDLINVSGNTPAGTTTGIGELDLSLLTNADPFDIVLRTLASDGTSGAALNFDGTVSKSWTLISTTNSINNFATNKFNIVTSAFSNAFSGSFSVALGDSNTDLMLIYTAPAPITRGASFTDTLPDGYTRRDDSDDNSIDLNAQGSGTQRVLYGVDKDGLNTTPANALKGSVLVNPTPSASGSIYVAMWLDGTEASFDALALELDNNANYKVRSDDAGETGDISADEWAYVESVFGTGFDILFEFNGNPGPFFNWEFSGLSGLNGVDAVAVIPEPTSLGLLGLGAMGLLARRRRR